MSERMVWEVGLGEHDVSCEQVARVARGDVRVSISRELVMHLERGEQFLERVLASRARVYGLTTGFGPLATTLVSPEQRATLQHQLIAHLATGVGGELDYQEARAVMCARLLTLAQGYSCASVSLLEQITAFLDAGLAPVIPRHGSVGASGDLTPLAHMARGLMGEGELMCDHTGVRAPAEQALASAGLAPLVLEDREALALVNGTSAMTGVAALTATRARGFLERCIELAVAYGEVMQAYPGAWSPDVGARRGQPGQQWVHDELWRRLQDSQRMPVSGRDVHALDRLPQDDEPLWQGLPLVQDAYSMRCVPQLLGGIKDTVDWHREVVERELVAVTDNPIFDVEREQIMHAGNFYGQHVASASDALKGALVTMMVWLERVAARLCDGVRNRGLPACLVWRADEVGLRSGFMGAQVTASALLALARTRGATMASVQSVPTNAANQDVVPMGTIAAMECAEVATYVSELLAIVAMMLAQAIELREESLHGFSSSSVRLFEQVRARVPRLEQDRALSDEIRALARHYMKTGG